MGNNANTNVRDSWQRIEAWLQQKAKRIFRTLEPAASDEQIAQLEQKIGQRLPDDVRESFRIHNGADESDLFPSSQPEDMAYSLLALSEISETSSWEFWKPGWIPLATNGGGDYQCVDVSSGEIIEANHEIQESVVIASSWSARLKDLADGLESKRYKYSSDDGIILPEPPDPMKWLREAKQDLEEDPSLPKWNYPPDPAPPEFTEALNQLDPTRERFGPASAPRRHAIIGIGRGVTIFYSYAEPRSVFDLNGLRFYPVHEAIYMNEPNFLPEPAYWPFVFATTVVGDHRLVFDTPDAAEYPPVLLFHCDVELAGKPLKQLKKSAKMIAPSTLEFFRRLARRELDLEPIAPHRGRRKNL